MRKHLVTAAVLASLALGVAPATGATAAPVAGGGAVAAPASTATPTLKPGSRGPAVVRVQRILEVKQSGVFDAVTVAAVKRFQKAHGIASSGGYVGPRTWAALRSVEAKQKAMRDVAMRSFFQVSFAAEKSLASTAKGAVTPTTGNVRLPAADAKLLTARVARVQTTLAAANKAAAAATTAGQVKAALPAARRALAASHVLEQQLGAAWVARPATFSAMLSGFMNDALAYAKKSGHPVDVAAEASARAKVLETGAVLQKSAALLALKLLSIDPLSGQAEARAGVLTKAIDAVGDTAAGKRFMDAQDAYSRLLFG